ncbi:SBBP repeat-containing protein [Emticicia agri]|uniref:Beta-propeller repeat protein n=1 Tax=Emticicia agri TaxID=2492393 RepID=A0A4Q5LWC1_9BACT|nr:SBBP repeat-containing protein [Emticicia agri]RYU93847.1 hypothetical protein EWM59_20215 [Emticicia agri]
MRINTLAFPHRTISWVKNCCVVVALLFTTISIHAQNVTILPSGITPLPIGYYPRLTYDAILALPSPEIGDLAVDLTFRCLRFYTGNRWARLINDDDLNLPAITAWAEGGNEADYGHQIAVDPNGFIYVCGRFRGVAAFENTILTSSGGDDLFIAKYNRAGALQWAKRAGGTGDDRANGIAVDASGNPYITGSFFMAADFSDTDNVTSAGLYDIFLAKYTTHGALQWVRSAGGTGYDIGNSIGLDASGNAYLTGSVFYNATFGDTTITSAGNADIFLAKYNSIGEKQWVRQAGSTMDDVGNAIAVDGSGNVYATGYFQGTASFGGTFVSATGSDIFICKYTTDGIFDWVRKAGGSLTDNGNGITVSSGGEVYVTGDFSGTATIGTASLVSAGGFDIFVAKYNLNGDFSWAQRAGGSGGDGGMGIVRDLNGNVFVTGYFINTATFGDTKITSLGNIDVFVAKYNIDGVLEWVQKAGTSAAEMSTGMTIDTHNNIYITGYFSGTATFGNTTISSAGSLDAFIARIKE